MGSKSLPPGSSPERSKAAVRRDRSRAPAPEKQSTRRRASEIIEAAARVFAERGFHGATTQDIADVLGIQQGSLYYYIQSKEDALEQVLLRGVEGVLETANRIMKGPGSPSERLESLIVSHLIRIRDQRVFVQVFLNEREHLPDASRHRIGKLSRDLERIFEKVLKEGIKLGEFRADLDTRVVTLAILGAQNTATSWHLQEGIAMERVAGEFVRLICDGVRRR